MNDKIDNIINSILPNKKIRQTCLILLLESIEKADSYGSNKWGIYYLNNNIRLLVGNLIVFTIFDGQIWLSLDKKLLYESKKDYDNLSETERQTIIQSIFQSLLISLTLVIKNLNRPSLITRF